MKKLFFVLICSFISVSYAQTSLVFEFYNQFTALTNRNYSTQDREDALHYLDLAEKQKLFINKIKYLEVAASLGSRNAMFELGEYFWDGNGIPQNKELAYQYFLQSATLGNSYAFHKLGDIETFQESPTNENIAAAYLYYSFSAMLGNEEAKPYADISKTFLESFRKKNPEEISILLSFVNQQIAERKDDLEKMKNNKAFDY